MSTFYMPGVLHRENKNKLRACEYEFLFSLQNKFISCEIN